MGGWLGTERATTSPLFSAFLYISHQICYFISFLFRLHLFPFYFPPYLYTNSNQNQWYKYNQLQNTHHNISKIVSNISINGLIICFLNKFFSFISLFLLKNYCSRSQCLYFSSRQSSCNTRSLIDI